MPAPDLRLRASVKVEPVLEPTDDMPIEYLSEGEKRLTKRQRLLVWNAVQVNTEHHVDQVCVPHVPMAGYKMLPNKLIVRNV